MPFTPSHAVVALPFLRSPLVPAAIAIGAMTPDLPLFVRVTLFPYAVTHDFAWLPVTMSVALALLVLWRCVLRPAARELAPGWLAARLPAAWDGGAAPGLRETFGGGSRGILLLVASLAIGVASHILWDLFTHEGRWGVEVLPALEKSWGPLTGFKWLQHGSSVLGLVILAIWAGFWLARRTPQARRRVFPAWVRWGWWMSLPVVLIIAWVWGLAAYGPLTEDWTIPHLAYRVLPPACAVWGALTLALAVAVQAARSRRDVSVR